MKMILAVVFAACLGAAASAQGSTASGQPAQPAASVQPPQPPPSAQPDSPQPPQPAPSVQPPQPALSPQPPQPAPSPQPPHPAASAQPASSQLLPTTPELPLTPLAGARSEPDKKITVKDLGINRVDTVAELKTKQAEEIRTLRESLKGRPYAEVRRAVRAKRAEQSAALKALLDANKTEAGEYKKISSKPAKE